MPETWNTRPSDVLRVRPGFDLSAFDTRSTPGFDGGKKRGERMMREHGERLSALQERLYAHGRSGGSRAVLLVLQGMDTAGKGGIVRHVLGMVDPQGVQSRSFGVPTPEEKSHHYLWRIRNALPSGGRIGVFDRSHYEDVLVVRVHDLVPGDPWERRYEEINAFEREVEATGTVVVKCAMMVSPEEQLERLSERLLRPDKFWKYNPGDLDERAHWPAYMEAYQALLNRTSTDEAPWYVVPADRKWYARLAVTQILIDTLEDMNLGWPPADFDVDVERARMDDLLAAAGRPSLAEQAADKD